MILNEGYEDRVKAVADNVIQYTGNSHVDKSELLDLIDRAAREEGVVEYQFKNRANSKTWPEFVKDVTISLKGKLARKPSSAIAKTEEKNKLLCYYPCTN